MVTDVRNGLQPLRCPTGPAGHPRPAIVGKTFSGFSVEFKVGNCGSEHVLAAHLRLSPLGALYLHTEQLGTWLQRRLNPVGYDSRITSLDVSRGAVRWNVWTKRNNPSGPYWRHGTITIDPRDSLLGRARYWYTNEGEPVTATVRMPHGDDHPVTLQLQRCEFGREKRRKRTRSWTVDWTCRGGIPASDGREIQGGAVEVPDYTVGNGTWPAAAAAEIARAITLMRASRMAVPVDA